MLLSNRRKAEDNGKMRPGNTAVFRIARYGAFLICLVMAALLLLPHTARAQTPERTVRVGWHEPPGTTSP